MITEGHFSYFFNDQAVTPQEFAAKVAGTLIEVELRGSEIHASTNAYKILVVIQNAPWIATHTVVGQANMSTRSGHAGFTPGCPFDEQAFNPGKPKLSEKDHQLLNEADAYQATCGRADHETLIYKHNIFNNLQEEKDFYAKKRAQGFDPIVEETCELLRSRSEVGIKKYGKTLERSDVTSIEWVTHAIEEALDLANYLVRLRKKLQEL